MATFLRILSAISGTLEQRIDEHIVETGLTSRELLVMCAAIDDPGNSAAAIRGRLGLRPSTYSSLIGRLQRRGYLTTRASRRDARTQFLIPTRPGRQAAQIARSIALDLETSAYPVDVAVLYRQLERLEYLVGLIPAVVLLDDGLPVATA